MRQDPASLAKNLRRDFDLNEKDYDEGIEDQLIFWVREMLAMALEVQGDSGRGRRSPRGSWGKGSDQSLFRP